MVRLGFWQLDRLKQRRIFNARVLEQTSQSKLALNSELQNGNLFSEESLTEMEYRKIVVTGKYDFTNEVALRNQVYQNQYGVHLLTPLKINGANISVLVDRGWIPGSDFDSGKENGNWSQFEETGDIRVEGVVRASQEKPDFGRISDPVPIEGEARIVAWNLTNLVQMQKQIPYPILPIYIQQAPDPKWIALPYRSEPNLEITEGPHLGYAIQWFTFAAILFLGYPLFFIREIQSTKQTLVPTGNLDNNSGE